MRKRTIALCLALVAMPLSALAQLSSKSSTAVNAEPSGTPAVMERDLRLIEPMGLSLEFWRNAPGLTSRGRRHGQTRAG